MPALLPALAIAINICRTAGNGSHAFAVQLKHFAALPLYIRSSRVGNAKNEADQTKGYGFRRFWKAAHFPPALDLSIMCAGLSLSRACNRRTKIHGYQIVNARAA